MFHFFVRFLCFFWAYSFLIFNSLFVFLILIILNDRNLFFAYILNGSSLVVINLSHLKASKQLFIGSWHGIYEIIINVQASFCWLLSWLELYWTILKFSLTIMFINISIMVFQWLKQVVFADGISYFDFILPYFVKERFIFLFVFV